MSLSKASRSLPDPSPVHRDTFQTYLTFSSAEGNPSSQLMMIPLLFPLDDDEWKSDVSSYQGALCLFSC